MLYTKHTKYKMSYKIKHLKYVYLLKLYEHVCCVKILLFCYVTFYIYISAAKWLIVINLIQNKSFCLHNIYVCTVYIMYKY